MQITTIGIDLAKTVFQLHAVDADGATVIRKRLRRAEVLSFVSGLEPCLIGMEACATSHYWARELAKFGHTEGAAHKGRTYDCTRPSCKNAHKNSCQPGASTYDKAFLW
jgi:hypothetical protein